MKEGIILLPEDRQKEGLIMSWGLGRNVTLPTISKYAKNGFNDEKTERDLSKRLLEEVDTKAVDIFQPASSLSGGNQQKVVVAKALSQEMKVVIMDEPTVGLDPKQIIEIRKLIKQLGEDHTVVLSSHILHEVADVCERVVIINKGEIVAQDTLDHLTHGISETFRMMIRVAGPAREVQGAIRQLDGTRYIEPMGTKEPDTVDFLVESDRNIDIRKPMFNAMAKLGYPLLMVRPLDVELEDIFLQLTSDKEEA